MKIIKKLISLTFVLGVIGILSSIYFTVTGHVVQTQLLVLVALSLVTIALGAALITATKDIQRTKDQPRALDPKEATFDAVIQILFSQ
jgi:hypothetical protein